MFCPNCHKEIPDNASFCTECGTKVGQPAAPAATPGVVTPGVTGGATPGITGGTPGIAATPLAGQAGSGGAAGAGPAPKPKMDNRKKGLLAGVGAAAAVAVVAILVVSFASPANAEVGIDEDNFPDDNFRTYVADNFDADGNGKLSQEELDSVTTIDLDGAAKAESQRVSDLRGIGHFRSLRTLNAPHNRLHGLPPDFRELHEVQVVNLTHNDITENIDISENTSIEVIYLPTDVSIDVTKPETTDVEQKTDETIADIVDEHPEAVDDETIEKVENGEATEAEDGEDTDAGSTATTDASENDAAKGTDESEEATSEEDSSKDSASDDAASEQSDSADASQATADVQAALQAKAESLGDSDHSVEYLYRVRGMENDPWFEWAVSDDLADGTAVGSRIADFDGDGTDELLSVVWRDGKVDLDMYEVSEGDAVLTATLSKDASIDSFPLLEGTGSFEVDASDDGALYLQWWCHSIPVGDGHEWAVMRVDYDGERFSAPNVSVDSGSTFSGGQSAIVQGTGGLDFTDLKADMQAMGLDVSRVPDTDSEADGNDFIFSSLSELDSSLSRVSCATATADTYDIQGAEDSGDEWSDLTHLGTFDIGPSVVPSKL